jgi:4-amino-4-deoxy-L-arabinose transferase-like glycosyltransferase
MHFALYPAFFFTVALLFTTGYFLLGGLPLLILKHDVPLDARFVRGFFNVYYNAAFWTALGACASYALWGRYVFAAAAGALAAVATLLRRYLLPAMDQLGERIQANEQEAIHHFRRVHSAALGINVVQLVVLVWGTLQLSRAVSGV